MPTYAIVESGGKQYRVEEGQFLLVDRLRADEGAKVGLRAVMFRDDDSTVLESSELEKVKVEATIAGHERGEKIRVFKYKAKKGYRKRHGHRSELTRLEVTEVKMLSRKPAGTADSRQQTADSGSGGAAEKPKKAAAPKKAPAKKADTEKKAAEKKPAAKKKPTAAKKKPAAKKPTAAKKKPAGAKKTPAKKTAAKKKPAAKKESD